MSNSMIPAHVDEITVDWLNDVLGDEFGTIETASIEHFAEGVGILGELARITLGYASGESGPATVIAKCPAASEENHPLAIAMGFYVREVNFYRSQTLALRIKWKASLSTRPKRSSQRSCHSTLNSGVTPPRSTS